MDGPMDNARERVIDELLVLRCQRGECECFDLLIRRWQRRLWRYARSLTGDDDAAWDVMQETWVAMLKRIRKLNDPKWFAAWACRIVRNKCADHCRRAVRRRKLTDDLARRREEQGRLSAGSSGHAEGAVAEALRRLPAEKQELLALKYGQDLNVVEIGAVLGIPAGTVKSRLHAAREQLRQTLEGDRS
jgi:RNA polymerase sigma factor (sigma-70 family)